MSYRRFASGNCVYSKWTMRCATSIIWAVISLLLLFRVLVWHRKHTTEVWMEHVSGEANQSSTNLGTMAQLHLTLCNVNPIKGFQVFLLPNGSVIYDSISDKWHSGQGQYSAMGIIDKEMVRKSSHDIKDMLIRCLSSTSNCSSDNFYPVWIDQRLCYQTTLSREDQLLTLALDPEEQHYLIPGLGFTGFIAYVDNVVTNDNKIPHTETFYISSALHSIIKISRSDDDSDPKCHLSFHQQCSLDCEDRSIQDCPCKDSLKHCKMSYRLVSNYQTTQSSFYRKLSQIRHLRRTSESCQDVVSKLIQRRALLIIVKKSFHREVVHLSDLIYHINLTSHKLSHLATSIQSQILSDIARLQLIEDDSGLCNLPVLLTQLNSTLHHIYTVPSYISTGFHECSNKTSISAYFELLVIKMIFDASSSSLKGPNLASKVNILTMMSIKFRDRFSSVVSCKNDIGRRIGALYSRLIRDYVSVFLDFSRQYSALYSQLTTLINNSAAILSVLRKNGINHNNFNLVTLSIEISSDTHHNIAKPQVYKSTAYPVNAISDLVDIICGNMALAALLLLVVRYFSHRCRHRHSAPRSIIRRDITTETTDMCPFPNDGSIQQITFTL